MAKGEGQTPVPGPKLTGLALAQEESLLTKVLSSCSWRPLALSTTTVSRLRQSL